jgi:hypothetical protein
MSDWLYATPEQIAAGPVRGAGDRMAFMLTTLMEQGVLDGEGARLSREMIAEWLLVRPDDGSSDEGWASNPQCAETR